MLQAPDSAPRSQMAAGLGVWDRLAERLNPVYGRPQLRHGVVARRFQTARGEEYYIAKSPRAGTYLRLAPDQHFILGLVDGHRQVKDLALA